MSQSVGCAGPAIFRTGHIDGKPLPWKRLRIENRRFTRVPQSVHYHAARRTAMEDTWILAIDARVRGDPYSAYRLFPTTGLKLGRQRMPPSLAASVPTDLKCGAYKLLAQRLARQTALL